MEKNSGCFSKRTMCLAVCLLCILSLLIALCGCAPKNDEGEKSFVERNLYLQSTAFLEDGETIVVYVGFVGESKNVLEGVKVGWESSSGVYNTWYNQSNTLITLSPSTIFSAVNALIPQEERIFDGIEYSVLKVYLKYDTIYKSIKSDAQTIAKSGKYYVHLFDIASDVTAWSYNLQLKQQNSASWYSVLIASCIGVCAISVGIYLSIKGGLWRNKKTK